VRQTVKESRGRSEEGRRTEEPAVLLAVCAPHWVHLGFEVAHTLRGLVSKGQTCVVGLALCAAVELELTLVDTAVLAPRPGPQEDGHIGE